MEQKTLRKSLSDTSLARRAPHFIPGYTGYVAQSPYQFGETFGQTTERLLTQHNTATSRIRGALSSSTLPPMQQNEWNQSDRGMKTGYTGSFWICLFFHFEYPFVFSLFFFFSFFFQKRLVFRSPLCDHMKMSRFRTPQRESIWRELQLNKPKGIQWIWPASIGSDTSESLIESTS